MTNKTRLMRVDDEFYWWVKNKSKKRNTSALEFTRRIPQAFITLE